MKLLNSFAHMIKRNSTTILSATAITGVATTAYLAARASFKASRILDREALAVGYERSITDKRRREILKEETLLVWKLYIPAAVSGVVTVACIVGVNKVGNKRALAAQAAFVLTERAYSEYREKVIDEFGEKKDEKIRELVAQDKVKNNPPSGEVTIITGGTVLCCELYTMRYFHSDIETLRKAQNDLNAQLIAQDQVSLQEWYYMIGLQTTSYASDYGWNSDKMMELNFSSVLTDDGRPCLAFEYNHVRLLYEGIFKD